jgi:hypothetical protein
MARDVCSGPHRVQVLHTAGQYVEDVVVRRGAAARITGVVRPALAFLGVYTSEGTGSLAASDADWQTAARHLSLRITGFVDPQVSAEEIRALRKKGSLPLERLLVSGLDATEALALVQSIASKSGRSDSFMFAVRSGNVFIFRLYSALQPVPDLIEVPNLDESNLNFLVSEIDAATKSGSRLRTLSLGLDVIESSKGLVILKNTRPEPEKGSLIPGAVIRSVERKPMNSGELSLWLRARTSAEPVTLEVVTGKENSSSVPVTLLAHGAEYPWHSPDAAPNAVLAMLRHVIERDPAADEAKYAALSLARGLMLQRHWGLALDVLARTNLEAHRAGVGAGTVLYYQGRCHEEMGDRGQAISFYRRAMEYPEATVGTFEGILITELAGRRIRNLSRGPG